MSALSEQEEFEFRLRAEQEASAPPKARALPVQPVTMGDVANERERFRLSIGSGVAEQLLGLKQRGSELLDAIDPIGYLTGNPYRRQEAVAQEVQQQRMADAPLRQGVAGKGGALLGGAAVAAPAAFIPGANRETGAAYLGGLLGFVQPTAENESVAQNTFMGAAGGQAGQVAADWLSGILARRFGLPTPQAQGAASSAADAGINVTPGMAASGATVEATPTLRTMTRENPLNMAGPSEAALTPLQVQMRDWGLEKGFRLTPGQATGNKALQRVEARFESQPLTSGTFDAIKDNNINRLTQSFLKEIGENADSITPDVLARAESRMGAVFEDAAKRNAIQYDGIIEQQLSEIEQQAVKELGESQMGIVRRQLEDVLKKAAENNGAISGQAYQNARQSLNRLSKGNDPAVGHWARQIRDVLDEGLTRYSSPEDEAALREVRKQWRVFATITDRQGAITGTGQISPGAAAAAVRQNDQGGYLLGRNDSDFYNALRFANAFPRIVNDSGTATRTGQAGITETMASIPMRIATGAYASSPGVKAAMRAQAYSQAVGDVAGPTFDWMGRRATPVLDPALRYGLPGLSALGFGGVPLEGAR